MEKYCVSLVLAQRMKELGFPQDTEFCWAQPSPYGTLWPDSNTEEYRLFYCEGTKKNTYTIAAPHVGELGEWLPEGVSDFSGKLHFRGDYVANVFYLEFEKDERKGWLGWYSNGEENMPPYNKENFDTEANARAKMLIYLVENKLLDVKNL